MSITQVGFKADVRGAGTSQGISGKLNDAIFVCRQGDLGLLALAVCFASLQLDVGPRLRAPGASVSLFKACCAVPGAFRIRLEVRTGPFGSVNSIGGFTRHGIARIAVVVRSGITRICDPFTGSTGRLLGLALQGRLVLVLEVTGRAGHTLVVLGVVRNRQRCTLVALLSLGVADRIITIIVIECGSGAVRAGAVSTGPLALEPLARNAVRGLGCAGARGRGVREFDRRVTRLTSAVLCVRQGIAGARADTANFMVLACAQWVGRGSAELGLGSIARHTWGVLERSPLVMVDIKARDGDINA